MRKIKVAVFSLFLLPLLAGCATTNDQVRAFSSDYQKMIVANINADKENIQKQLKTHSLLSEATIELEQIESRKRLEKKEIELTGIYFPKPDSKISEKEARRFVKEYAEVLEAEKTKVENLSRINAATDAKIKDDGEKKIRLSEWLLEAYQRVFAPLAENKNVDPSFISKVMSFMKKMVGR